jgi:peptidoglycan/xylan/chitin deacetylase (PgdA/CDA1 family)
MPATLAIKVDVDTERGTRVGVPNLLRLFDALDVRATFLFSLGPDNTGRAMRRIFRPGFFGKAMRTNVLGVYGVRTLLNGVLLPGPHIGRRHAGILRTVRGAGHEVGIHCYDHIRWQDSLARMEREQVLAEFAKARAEFERIFAEPAKAAGAAGWQANAFSLEAYDAAGLAWASDARGTHAFLPRAGGCVYRTLQIPTTLPTLDELLGRPEYPQDTLVRRYLSWLLPDRPNVLTVHAEIEGMAWYDWFRDFAMQAKHHVRYQCVGDVAAAVRNGSAEIPVCDLVAGTIDGRSGTLAVQAGVMSQPAPTMT